MKNIIGLISGILFGAGLTVSQMVNPHKVLSFLDIFGNWDPSLIVVMCGALLVYSIGYHVFLKSHNRCFFNEDLDLPKKKQLDRPLVLGAMLFGIGWGLSGICPGPALANVLGLQPKVYGFIVAMLIGIYSHHALRNKKGI